MQKVTQALGLGAAFDWLLAGLSVRAAGLVTPGPVAGDFWTLRLLDLFLFLHAFDSLESARNGGNYTLFCGTMVYPSR